jgi:hypothetical protein
MLKSIFGAVCAGLFVSLLLACSSTGRATTPSEAVDAAPPPSDNACAAAGGTCISTASRASCGPGTIVSNLACAADQGADVRCCLLATAGDASADADPGADAACSSTPSGGDRQLCTGCGTTLQGRPGLCAGQPCGPGCTCNRYYDRSGSHAGCYCADVPPHTCVTVTCGDINCDMNSSCVDQVNGVCN